MIIRDGPRLDCSASDVSAPVGCEKVSNVYTYNGLSRTWGRSLKIAREWVGMRLRFRHGGADTRHTHGCLVRARTQQSRDKLEAWRANEDRISTG